jgi:hypothetical protein
VVLAHASAHRSRAEFDVREPAPKSEYYPRPWAPDRPTLVYIGAVPIGLTLFEVTEKVEVVYVNGDYLPVRGLTAEQLRRYREPAHWRTHRYHACGRLCLQAYSPEQRVFWTQQWRETEAGQLTGLVPKVVRELEGAAPELARRIAEAEKAAAAEHIAWQAQLQRQREAAEHARRIKARQDAKSDLQSAIAAWNEAQGIRAYFAAMERALDTLSESERQVAVERLEKARALIGNVDPLAVLKQWKAPEER